MVDEHRRTAADGMPKTTLSREDAALEYRKAGMTLKEIGVKIAEDEGRPFPFNTGTADQWIKRALRKLCDRNTESSEELRQFELARLDALIAGLWRPAKMGNPDSVRQLVGVLDRRYRLLGIEPPKRIEHDVRMMSWVQLMSAMDKRLIERGERPAGLLAAAVTDGYDEPEEDVAETGIFRDVEFEPEPASMEEPTDFEVEESEPSLIVEAEPMVEEPTDFDWSTDFDE